MPSLSNRLDQTHTPRLSKDDAEALLDINAMLRAPSPEWVAFVGESVSTWLVEHRAPEGIVDMAKARWLLARMDRRGDGASPAALAVLRRCCVKAQQVPAALIRYLRFQERQLRLAAL